ncbi:HAD-IB family hydrolase [Gallaecimonas kandeliae]|uniref:HAD family hydrolase n=1 Tax=Gallaecimonas kandeliae TaxID=3029055 RepID=UPI00264770CF|nr:HAD family hydrolase [Gallaecimonas kandeliae]WKE66356.1 HAD-IB family hydrolase [Gallaecimonas kandeliae]
MNQANRVAVFDLDHTLIDTDSANGFGLWAHRQGLWQVADLEGQLAHWHRLYVAGALPVAQYLEFIISPLAGKSVAEVAAWVEAFAREEVLPKVRPQAMAALEAHRAAGERVLVASATIAPIVAGICALLGVEELIATELAVMDGRYTGQGMGVPSIGPGKAWRLGQLLGGKPAFLTAYSDSINDLALLSLADSPQVVTPDARLAAVAEVNGWPVHHW